MWSRELILELILKYKSLPSLWKVKSESYSNQLLRANDYKELVRFCKKNGFPNATRDFVAKKIQSLRGAFRKELRKTRKLESEGVAYQSNLWYYKHLLFTVNQDGSDDTDDVVMKYEQSDEECQMEETYLDEEYIDEEEIANEVKTTNVMHVVPPHKRLKTDEENDALEYDAKYQDSPRELTEAELTGLSITKKISRMNSVQAVYAEFLINNVLKRGLLRKLNQQTSLCDNVCEKARVVTVTDVPTSSRSSKRSRDFVM